MLWAIPHAHRDPAGDGRLITLLVICAVVALTGYNPMPTRFRNLTFDTPEERAEKLEDERGKLLREQIRRDAAAKREQRAREASTPPRGV